MNYVLLSGHSKGLGKAIDENLKKEDEFLLGISRSKKKYDLKNRKYFEIDLSKDYSLEECLQFLKRQKNIQSLSLINNAGSIEPMGKLINLKKEEIQKTIFLNFMSPLILLQNFAKEFQNLPVPKQVYNISSGAATSPYAGWSIYCATKAALDMGSLCFQEEQKKENYPIRVFKVIPGIFETSMQEKIRAMKEEGFPEVEKFQNLHKTGKLKEPNEVAQKLIHVIRNGFRGDFSPNFEINLRN